MNKYIHIYFSGIFYAELDGTSHITSWFFYGSILAKVKVSSGQVWSGQFRSGQVTEDFSFYLAMRHMFYGLFFKLDPMVMVLSSLISTAEISAELTSHSHDKSITSLHNNSKK